MVYVLLLLILRMGLHVPLHITRATENMATNGTSYRALNRTDKWRARDTTLGHTGERSFGMRLGLECRGKEDKETTGSH